MLCLKIFPQHILRTLYLYMQRNSSYSVKFSGSQTLIITVRFNLFCVVLHSATTLVEGTLYVVTLLATITNVNAGPNTQSCISNWSRLSNHGTNKYDNNWIRWYLSNGVNGEFSKSRIYGGRTGDQQINSTIIDQRFDAICIRTRVRVQNVEQNISPQVFIYGSSKTRVGFHVSPLILCSLKIFHYKFIY